MNVGRIEEFPFVEFGDEIKRKVRLIVSPDTTGEERLSIVSVNLPPAAFPRDIHTMILMSIFSLIIRELS